MASFRQVKRAGMQHYSNANSRSYRGNGDGVGAAARANESFQSNVSALPPGTGEELSNGSTYSHVVTRGFHHDGGGYNSGNGNGKGSSNGNMQSGNEGYCLPYNVPADTSYQPPPMQQPSSNQSSGHHYANSYAPPQPQQPPRQGPSLPDASSHYEYYTQPYQGSSGDTRGEAQAREVCYQPQGDADAQYSPQSFPSAPQVVVNGPMPNGQGGDRSEGLPRDRRPHPHLSRRQQQQQQQLPPTQRNARRWDQGDALHPRYPLVTHQEGSPPSSEPHQGKGDSGEEAEVAQGGPFRGGSDAVCSPMPLQYHDYTGGPCGCPSCLQSEHIAYVFRKQRQASPHVLKSRPSPFYVGTGGMPPEPPPLRPSELVRCPVFDSFGFCPYSAACFLKHIDKPVDSFVEVGRAPRVLRGASPEEEVKRLVAKAAKHRDNELWSCDVCGYSGINDMCINTVGSTYYYRYCPRCTYHCYFPYVTYLVEHLLESVGDDYQQFKNLVDLYRGQVPDEFKVPLTAEAHRVGSIVFSWSLVTPAQVRDAIEAAHKVLPEMESITSVGSAAGYIEHVFNRVMNPGVSSTQFLDGLPHRTGSRFSVSSFDGVQTSFYGKRTIPIHACDQIPMRISYSVHVSLNGPLALLSMSCENIVLLLCWPPFGSPDGEQSSMGFEALEYFRQCNGRVVICIGDVSTTGDWRFHQLLYMHFKLVKDYPVRREVRRWCPAEMGYVYSGNDTIGVYERRPEPIPLHPNWACTM